MLKLNFTGILENICKMKSELTEGDIHDTNAIPKKVTPLKRETDNWYVLEKLSTSLITGFKYQELTVFWNLQTKTHRLANNHK